LTLIRVYISYSHMKAWQQTTRFQLTVCALPHVTEEVSCDCEWGCRPWQCIRHCALPNAVTLVLRTRISCLVVFDSGSGLQVTVAAVSDSVVLSLAARHRAILQHHLQHHSALSLTLARYSLYLGAEFWSFLTVCWNMAGTNFEPPHSEKC